MKALSASLLLISISTTVVAQSNYKESSNSFALYTQSKEIKHLESAKKFIDAGYKTKRDSVNRNNNVLRAMIYSSLAYADSTRKIKTDKDPIDITLLTLDKIKERDKSYFSNELNYVNQNLIAAYIYKANKDIEKKDFKKAYDNFLQVSKLGSTSEDVLRNLAFLSAQAGKTDEAISYYKSLIKSDDAEAKIYLSLAELYKIKKDNQLYLNTLQDARNKFPMDNSVLFLLIEAYAENKSYGAITPIIGEALKADPDNKDLFYLAGYANENTGNIDLAKNFYLKTLELEEEDYDANLALGLIYLKEFLKDKDNLEGQYSAQEYLLKANGIKPYALNALKGLALYYEAVENADQLDRVKTLIESITE